MKFVEMVLTMGVVAVPIIYFYLARKPTVPYIRGTFTKFTVVPAPGGVNLELKGKIESFPAEIAYCSIEYYIDGVLSYGECWSNLGEVPWCHPGVSAPATIGFSALIPIPGVHEYMPRCYARNVNGNYIDILGEPITVESGPAGVEVTFTAFSIEATDGEIMVTVNAHIESDPAHMDYVGVDLWIDEVLYYGECWSDHPEAVCVHPADVYAPADCGFVLNFIPGPGVHKYKARCYARNINGVSVERFSNIISFPPSD